jgi:hypothetical protein
MATAEILKSSVPAHDSLAHQSSGSVRHSTCLGAPFLGALEVAANGRAGLHMLGRFHWGVLPAPTVRYIQTHCLARPAFAGTARTMSAWRRYTARSICSSCAEHIVL